MNTIALKIIMIKNGDNGLTLSRYLGISRSTLSAKMSKNSKSEFTQNEILKIKKKYNLTAYEVDEIFFDSVVS